MNIFKYLAFASIISLASAAQGELKVLDDTSMDALTAKAGITIDL